VPCRRLGLAEAKYAQRVPGKKAFVIISVGCQGVPRLHIWNWAIQFVQETFGREVYVGRIGSGISTFLLSFLS
jgi:hypothetical protein